MNHLLRPRIWTSFLASSGVGPCDVPFRYASASILDFGFRISDFLPQLMIVNLTVQIFPFVLWFSPVSVQIFNPHLAIAISQSSTRWPAHFRGLATAIHEISGLDNFTNNCCLISSQMRFMQNSSQSKTGVWLDFFAEVEIIVPTTGPTVQSSGE